MQIVKWWWSILENFNHERRIKLIKLITGSSRLPLKGFKHLKMLGSNFFTLALSPSANKESLPLIQTWYKIKISFRNYGFSLYASHLVQTQ